VFLRLIFNSCVFECFLFKENYVVENYGDEDDEEQKKEREEDEIGS
jgi:hypothetical protein